jgi:FAD/FMN-containing dehydrogenase
MGGLRLSSRGAVSAGNYGTKKFTDFTTPLRKRSDRGAVPLPDSGRQVLNDVSQLNPTEVYKVVAPTTVEEVQAAIRFARAKGLKISISGAKNTMGGQTLYEGSLHLDMSKMNKMYLDHEEGNLHIQSGAKWIEAQRYLDPQGVALDIMQTPNIFSVGGTMGANAHGSNPDSPPFIDAVQSFRLVNADGELITCSRAENPECFSHVVGGYGLFGVVVDARLRVVPNEMYTMRPKRLDYTEYPAFQAEHGRNPEIAFEHALVSVAPDTLLKEMLVQSYYRSPDGEIAADSMQSDLQYRMEKAAVDGGFYLMRQGKLGRWLSWALTSRLAPYLQPKRISRNAAMNLPIPNMPKPNDVYSQILHDYYIPRENFAAFMDMARLTIKRHKAQLLIAAVRPVAKDTQSALPYAKTDVYSLVMFYNQKRGPEGEAKMEAFTRDMINAAAGFGGRFYLPYRLAYTREQFDRVYPEGKEFFETKRKMDPEEMFMNKFYEKYGAVRSEEANGVRALRLDWGGFQRRHLRKIGSEEENETGT